MKAVEVLGLSKSYGRTAALKDVSFDVEPGDAVALIGPNGAGKTTLLRILATLIKPSGGYAKVLEIDGRFHASKIRKRIGYMPDALGMYEDLTVREYLRFFAGVYGIEGRRAEATVRDLVKLLDMENIASRPTSALSRGMQQRVGLGRTLVHEPSILLLDEPAANLDPRSRIEIREILKELRNMGKTILISSHILMELDQLCNKVLLMDHGKVRHFGSISDLAGSLRPHVEVRVRIAGDQSRFSEMMRMERDVDRVTEQNGSLKIRLREGSKDYSFVVSKAVESGMVLLSLQEEEPGLEEVFLKLTGGKKEEE